MAQQISKALLTIAIPTYNRRDYLEECLNHICPQLSEEVILVVRDNCSTNYNFKSFIESYEKQYGITAYQNVVNIGSDANCAKLFELCETKWLWVLGDDDFIKDGAVEIVLNTIKNNPDEVIVKFNSNFIGETVGIDGFAKAMKVRFQFGNTYFISETVYNAERTKNMMFFQYKYLSLLIAHLMRVICFLLQTQNEKCLFVKDTILEEHGLDITWNRIELVERHLTLMRFFRREKHIFKDNIFKEIIQNSLITICNSSLGRKERYYYYRECMLTYGFFSTIIYARRQMLHVIVRETMGNAFVEKLTKP